MAVRPNPVRIESRDAEILLEHRAYVHRLCRILLRDSDESEDAAQQALLDAHRALADGVRPIDGRAWLAEIARNECRSRLRRAAARPEAPLPDALPAAGSDPVELVARNDLLARLRDELAELPERQRRAVLLREFRGLSYDELATEMAETGPAVESLLQRARRRLTRRLVPAALTLDWARSMLARLGIGQAASEAAATGGAAALVAKLAAAGVVAVGVTAGGADLQRPTSSPNTATPTRSAKREPPPAVASIRSTASRVLVAVPRHSSHGRSSRSVELGTSPSGSSGAGRRDGGRERGSSPSEGPGPAAPAPTAPAPEPVPVESGSSSSGPGPGSTEAEPPPGSAEAAESPAEQVAELETQGGGEERSSSGGSSSGSDRSGPGSGGSASSDGSGGGSSGSGGPG